MIKCYNINDSVLFYPENKIISSSLTGNTIKINTPTAQLFEFFITSMGLTIPQNELYSVVWGEKGNNITPNTLYQNISLLRKALQDSGIPRKSLKTLRNKGFIFTVDSVSEKYVDDNISLQEKNHSLKNNRRAIYSIIISTITVVSFFIGALFFDYKHQTQKTNNNQSNFILTNTVNDCQFFKKIEDEDIINEPNLDNLLKNIKPECTNYPYLYMSYNEKKSIASIISCEYEISYNGKNNCKNEVFIIYTQVN